MAERGDTRLCTYVRTALQRAVRDGGLIGALVNVAAAVHGNAVRLCFQRMRDVIL
jgi:hypothetical protein